MKATAAKSNAKRIARQGCRTVVAAPGLTVMSCGLESFSCDGIGCGGRAATTCGHKLHGKLEGQTCDKALCAKCAIRMPDGTYRCSAHARLEGIEGA